MEILFLAGIAGWIVCAWKWADWGKFRHFQASIYVYIIGDFLYNILTEGRHLWKFVSPNFHISHHILVAVISFGAAPFAIMLFLSRYPEKKTVKRQVLYIALWVAIYTSHEWIALQAGIFRHDYGWNLWWSLLLNSIAFPFIRLHYKKPVAAIFVFLFCTIMFSIWFDVQLFSEQGK
ncbi:CBO0543 family protein [Cohnella sp.]|uniref:CBO0543 family protein n=1 Tax=Cohnella sp. TaxID=1883426 RepID=UPI003563A2A1